MSFDDARAIADAVLFEGYALYPYRASAPKNQFRWQFGVLAPRVWSEGGGGDPWWQETQCLVTPRDPDARLDGKVRFLQLRRRQQADQGAFISWDEGETKEIDFSLASMAATGDEQTFPFLVPGGVDAAGGVIHRRWPISGVLRLCMEPVAELPYPVAKLRARLENVTAWMSPGERRDQALRGCLLGSHLLLSISGGAFLSVMDPPPWAVKAAAACRNVRTYPVLAGKRGRTDLLLSAPMILEDHPQVAPESPRDLFDASEIDEILTLRILTLTDEEKREMRATDPRLGALLDGVETLDAEGMARLHGVTRELRPIDPLPASEAPAPSRIRVGDAMIGPGARVRLRPGARRADAQDMFLAGLVATVEAIMRDVDDQDCLAVTIDDDPAREIMRWQRRFHYFYPDEIEPLETAVGTEAS